MKYIAALLIAAGIIAILAAWRIEPSASFDDGTFLGMAGLAVGGAALCVIGGIWLAVLQFMAL